MASKTKIVELKRKRKETARGKKRKRKTRLGTTKSKKELFGDK